MPKATRILNDLRNAVGVTAVLLAKIDGSIIEYDAEHNIEIEMLSQITAKSIKFQEIYTAKLNTGDLEQFISVFYRATAITRIIDNNYLLIIYGNEKLNLGVILHRISKAIFPLEKLVAAISEPEIQTTEPVEAAFEEELAELTSVEVVDERFFKVLEQKLKKHLSTMSSIVISDKITEIGEDQAAFPRDKCVQLVERIMTEIDVEQARMDFWNDMASVMEDF